MTNKQSVTFKADALSWMPYTKLALQWFITYRDCLDDVQSFKQYRDTVADDIAVTSAFLKDGAFGASEEAAQVIVELAIARTLIDWLNERIATLTAHQRRMENLK